MRRFSPLLAVGAALLAGSGGFAQVIVPLPSSLAAPARRASVALSSPATLPVPDAGPRDPAVAARRPIRKRPAAPGLRAPAAGPADSITESARPLEAEIFGTGETVMRRLMSSDILLSTFSPDFAGSGAVRSGTTWVGNVTQNPTTISVGGTARDDNGWGVTGLTLDATGMNSIILVAQRNAGNTAPALFLQFEDRLSATQVFSVSTSLFAVGTLTTVQIPLGAWNLEFAPTQIVGWNIGGGGVGTNDFRMTLDNLSFSATAIPEPASVALALGAAALGLAGYRRRKQPPPAPGRRR